MHISGITFASRNSFRNIHFEVELCVDLKGWHRLMWYPSPNAEEALSLLGKSDPSPTKESIQSACAQLLELSASVGGTGCVIIRSGALGAYVQKPGEDGHWVDAFWQDNDRDKVIDVTGKSSRSVALMCYQLISRCWKCLPGRLVGWSFIDEWRCARR